MFKDPAIIGPGIWFNMHSTALQATTDYLKQAFIKNTNTLCDAFKCQTCQIHFRKHLDNTNFQNYWNLTYKGKDIGFFKWTWEFHNIVNKKLKKPEPTFEEAYNYFSDSNSSICTTCGSKSDTNENSNITPSDNVTTNYTPVPTINSVSTSQNMLNKLSQTWSPNNQYNNGLHNYTPINALQNNYAQNNLYNSYLPNNFINTQNSQTAQQNNNNMNKGKYNPIITQLIDQGPPIHHGGPQVSMGSKPVSQILSLNKQGIINFPQEQQFKLVSRK